MFECQCCIKIFVIFGLVIDLLGVLEDLFCVGVNVVCLNFSYGDLFGQVKCVVEVCVVVVCVGVEVGILVDLLGLKICIECFVEGKVQLKVGDCFDLIVSENVGLGIVSEVGVSYFGLLQDVGLGDVLLFDDGLMQLQVVEVQGDCIVNIVFNDGVLFDCKGLNKQGGGFLLGVLIECDKELIGIVVKIGVDFIVVLFCCNVQDMNDVCDIVCLYGCDVVLVLKIECIEVIENLEEIVEVSDVVMVVCGDLGVEIGDVELLGLQKKIIKVFLVQNKVVIIVMQMLQLMVESLILICVEVLDVVNLVIDGIDVVMLLVEIVVGVYLVKVVEVMVCICLGVECQFQIEIDFNVLLCNLECVDQVIVMVIMFLLQYVGVCVIVVMIEFGGIVCYLLCFCVKVLVFVVICYDGVCCQMVLMCDVFLINFDSRGLILCEVVCGSICLLVELELLQVGDCVVFISGEYMEIYGVINILCLLEVGEDGCVIGLGDL